MSSFKIEAETMVLATYRLESKDVASGGQYISLRGGDNGETGTASFTFDGLTGSYDVVLKYFDETDGVSQLKISQEGTLIDAWDLNQDLGTGGVRRKNLTQRTVATRLSINNGDAFTIQGIEDGGEAARVDYIEFIPLMDTSPSASLSASDITSGGTKTYTFTATYADNTAIDVSSLDSADIKILGPKGFEQLAELIAVDREGDGTPRQATYQITAPGGNWDRADNGTYTVSVEAQQVSDINKNFLSAGSLGSFQVNVVEEKPIRIEAETMALATYRLESKDVASGGQYISLRGGDNGETGTASFTFDGLTGSYDVVLKYFDETDGVSQLKISQEGTLIDAWDLNQDLGTGGVRRKNLTQRTVATRLSINNGDTFTIQGIEDGGEAARVDYIEFIPIKSGTGSGTPNIINGTNATETLIGDASNNIINGLAGNDTLKGEKGNDLLAGGSGNDTLDGGEGTDTADYTQAANGIIANLSTGTVLALSGTSAQPKIMPLGDSITAGLHRVDPTPGAYRTQLWNNFIADGLSVDFVGSLSDGPDSLGDRDHEGRGGWTINRITTELVNSGLIKSYQPEFILLMSGTNDSRNDTVSRMYADLGNLIEGIVDELPNTQLLVSSIAPIDPSGSKFGSLSEGQIRADKVEDFNALIPNLVKDKAAQGKKVTFADIGGSITVDDLVSDGIHPNSQGYNKMGDAWYSALVERDTLVSIENLIGTAFDDRLEGDTRDNFLTGGVGSDSLTGDEGADTFVYNSQDEGSDLITDFSVDDRFRISASGFGGGLAAGVNLSTTVSPTGVFVSSTNPTPVGTSANFLYNSTTGLLSFDGDGVRQAKALPVARLENAPSLMVEQLAIVA